MIELRPEFRFSSQIWPNSSGFGPFWLDLGHFAWIWAIMLRFEPYCLDLGYLGSEMMDLRQELGFSG